MTLAARAFWVTEPGCGEIRATEIGEAGPGQVLVEASYSAVSRGTEALVFEGRVPPAEYERMRCPHQEGQFPAPVKYGYASVGRVLEGASAWRARTVFCLHPHQSHYLVPEADVVAVPEGVPPARAVLAANMETALNALWDARPLVGDRISVVGGGVIGCLTAYLCSRAFADVELIDVLPERASLAAALGVAFATPEQATRGRDLVFHASGSAEGLRSALTLADADAQVIELSWFGDREVALPLGEAFHAERLTLRSSQVGTVSPHARRRFTHRRRLELALLLCREPQLDLLFSGESELEALPDVMRELARPGAGAVCHRIRYGTQT